MKDLYIITADKSMEFTVRGALERHRALGIRPVSFDIIHHPHKDGGVRTSGVQMLDLQIGRYEHGLILLDWEGCGVGSRVDCKRATYMVSEAYLPELNVNKPRASLAVIL